MVDYVDYFIGVLDVRGRAILFGVIDYFYKGPKVGAGELLLDFSPLWLDF
jgi:hypothetical protein